jgi:hypothetical protein
VVEVGFTEVKEDSSGEVGGVLHAPRHAFQNRGQAGEFFIKGTGQWMCNITPSSTLPLYRKLDNPGLQGIGEEVSSTITWLKVKVAGDQGPAESSKSSAAMTVC